MCMYSLITKQYVTYAWSLFQFSSEFFSYTIGITHDRTPFCHRSIEQGFSVWFRERKCMQNGCRSCTAIPLSLVRAKCPLFSKVPLLTQQCLYTVTCRCMYSISFPFIYSWLGFRLPYMSPLAQVELIVLWHPIMALLSNISDVKRRLQLELKKSGLVQRVPQLWRCLRVSVGTVLVL